MNTRRFSGTAVMAIFMSGIACFHFGCSKRVAVVGTPVVEAAANPQGLAQFSILTKNSDLQASASSTYHEVVPPRPIGELKSPEYPESAFRSNFGSARIVVRVHLDDAGRVIDIDENSMGATAKNRHAKEFQIEIDKAVRQWKFRPAELQECEKGKDLNGDGKMDYTVVISRKKIPVYFDVEFEFSIVDGKGIAPR